MDNNIGEKKSIAGLRAYAAAFLINLSFFAGFRIEAASFPIKLSFSMGFSLLIPIIALILEQENGFVRAYAKQTLAVTVLLLISTFLNIIIVAGNILFFVIFVILSVFQIIATVSSALKKEFKIPFIEKITDLLFVN